MSARIPIAITMGDPAGIGPEVALRGLRLRGVAAGIEPILVGDEAVWRETAVRLGLTGRLPRIVATSQLRPTYRRPGLPRRGAHTAACGQAAYDAILGGFELVRSGTAAALVTAPISKAHVHAAGHDFPGHTELLAHLAGDVPVRMMLAGPRLRVVLVTIHVAIASVPKLLDVTTIVDTVRITAAALRLRFGVARPRIAVAGLNPHAGEGGLFGDEEIRIIAPAVHQARRLRLDVQGPLAADGIFAHAASGGFDAVVCMYHDQGLGPFKLLHFADGVNVTLGLPFVRTSPDHGTAFDIAGRGTADARSMAAAIGMAARSARLSA